MSETADNVYKPDTWEKICAVVAASWIIALASYLIIRNQPLEDNAAVLMRILVSMGVAIFGAVIPGFIKVDLTWKGVAIRAGGALALFVLTFFFTPKVFHESFQETAAWERPQTGLTQLNGDFIRLIKSSSDPDLVSQELSNLNQPHINLIAIMQAAERDQTSLSRPSKLVSLYDYLSMAHYQLAEIARYRAIHENIAEPIATQLHKEAIHNAEICVTYATKGLELYNKILNTSPTELHNQMPIWPENLYLLSQQKLREYNYSLDLTWYKTAGRAILSCYGKVPFEQIYNEVILLKAKTTVKDPVEDDPTMKWMLSSTNRKCPERDNNTQKFLNQQ
jgi:hypothetical protein